MKFGISGGKKKGESETKMIAKAHPKQGGFLKRKSKGEEDNNSSANRGTGIDVDKRREEVLARGRKFKYPLQHAKHKVLINTLIVGIVAIIALFVTGWIELYKVQDMGDIMYRISTVLPVAVADVDGEKVLFSDYLRRARSSLMALGQEAGLENGGNEADLEAMKKEYKRWALTQEEYASYAEKIGKEKGITVSEEEINAAFNEYRKVGGTERSEESFLKVLETNLGLSKTEYRRMLYRTLIRQKVEQEIDMNANKIASEVEAALNANGGDFNAVAEAMGEKVQFEDTGGLIDDKNVDGGRAGKASSLEVGTWTGKFLSSNGDGYYFVKTLEKGERQVHYVSLYIPFTELKKEVERIKEEGLIKEYIELE